MGLTGGQLHAAAKSRRGILDRLLANPAAAAPWRFSQPGISFGAHHLRPHGDDDVVVLD
jgi:hypothetical protein